MLKEICHDSFENFEITRMENHASVTGWQKLFSTWQMAKVHFGRSPSSETQGQSVGLGEKAGRTWKLSSRLVSRPDWLPLGLRGWVIAYGRFLCLCFLLNFGNFHQAMPFVYTIIISPLECFLSRSCVTDAAYCGRKKPNGEINNVHSGYPTLVLKFEPRLWNVQGIDS